MQKVILKHPSLGKRTVKVEDFSKITDGADWIVMKPRAASNELFEASEYYKPSPELNKFYPHWGLLLNDGVEFEKM